MLSLVDSRDLIVTCMSPHGRNRAVGQQLADGKQWTKHINHTNMAVEGSLCYGHYL